jgi:putative N-acetyltransferase (TIGR04045 family)
MTAPADAPFARPFTAPSFTVKFADRPWEFRDAAALRRRVFCDEQGIFTGHDRDAIDAVAIPIVAVSTLAVAAGDVVGTVRIHEPEPGHWMGSRLAVAADHRRIGALGAALIRVAVSAAHARGCRRFTAHVQSQNAPMFAKLHWRSLDEMELHGRPHHLMEADLAHYPPLHDAVAGITALARMAA